MGTITPLDAFSELPARLRTSEMINSMETGIEFLLKHRLFRADHHDFKVIKESWLTVAQNLYKSGNWIQDCCLVPGSSRQHCDSSGNTMSYSLSAGIYCPRPTDGDCRTVLRLGSRFRLGSTYNDSLSEYIRTYRMRVFYPIFI